MTRILTAVALIPAVIYIVLWSNPWIFIAAVAAVAFLCSREYDSIAQAYGFGAPGPVGFAAGFALLFIPSEAWLLITIVTLVALALSMRADDLADSLPRAALLLLGVVYIFGCWRAAIPLRQLDPHWLMFTLIVNWAGDGGAYYTGRAFGRRSLAPVVSPNKTWEGAAASVASSVLFAGGYLYYFIPNLAISHIIAIAVLANIAGQFGDLAESTLKRGAGVKDSGTLLPGHGGLLDRCDSTLFSLPVTYAYLRFFLYYMG